MKRSSQLLLLTLLATLLAGCETLSYYRQAVGGHLSLMMSGEEVAELLEDPETDPALKQQLRTANQARRFARNRLDLPVGDSYSDYVALDRRWVLVWLSVAAVGACLVTVTAAGLGEGAILLAATLFGLTTFPVYSVAPAHAHDFASADQRVELSAALMFVFALGAIAAPWTTSILIEHFGPAAMFHFVALGHIGLIVFGVARMRVRGAPARRTRYVWAPRTSFTIGRLLGRSRDRDEAGN